MTESIAEKARRDHRKQQQLEEKAVNPAPAPATNTSTSATATTTATATTNRLTPYRRMTTIVQEEPQQQHTDGGLRHFRKTSAPNTAVVSHRGSIMTPSSLTSRHPPTNDHLVLERYFVDHHSLTVPSSTVRYRGNTNNTASSNRTMKNNHHTSTVLAPAGSYVIENEYQQIILEEKIKYDNTNGTGPSPHGRYGQRTIQVKKVGWTGTKGVQVLRACYVIIFFLWVGIFVVFCVQICLDLVMLLPMTIEKSMDDGQTIVNLTLIGIFLALISFIVAFAEGMVIATNLVSDTWNGKRLYKSLLIRRESLIFLDWFAFILLLAIPLCSIAITMFVAPNPTFYWWTVGCLIWFACVNLYFLVFTVCVVYYELYGATSYVCNHYYFSESQSYSQTHSYMERFQLIAKAAHQCILMRQMKKYSGRKYIQYLAQNIVEDDEDTPCDRNDSNNNNNNDTDGGNGGSNCDQEQQQQPGMIKSSYREYMFPFSYVTMWKGLKAVYTVLDKPQKMYNINDAQGLHPFMTKWTWSLERMFCNINSSRYIAIIDGPGAMTRNQILSSFVCFIMGIVIIMLLFVAFLSWFDFPTSFLIVVSIIMICVLLLLVWMFHRRVTLILRLNKTKKEFNSDYVQNIFGWVFNQHNDVINEIEEECTATNIADIDYGTNDATAIITTAVTTTSTMVVPDNASDPSVSVEIITGAADNKESNGIEDSNLPADVDNPIPAEMTNTTTIIATTNDKKQHQDSQRESKQRRRRRDSTFIEGHNTGLYVISKTMRVSEASHTLCYIGLVLEILVCYLWPLLTLFVLSKWKIGIIYAISVGTSTVRHYINIAAVIEETGTMNLSPMESRTDRWLNQSRLNEVVEKISTDNAKNLWLVAMSLGALAFAGIWGMTIHAPLQGNPVNEMMAFLPANEFRYPAHTDTVQYPSCIAGKPFSSELNTWSLADYAFLSIMAYRSDTIIDQSLPIWFGPSGQNVTLLPEPVDVFRKVNGYENTPGIFYLFEAMTTNGTVGIISVRGTSSKMEMLVDCQLWLAAFLIQLLRFGLPFGALFTPILPYINYVIHSLSQNLNTNLYQVITQFIGELRKDSKYNDLLLTGHSLGGGIAFLSGAQAHVKAVALSGVNAMLSRLTFDPPISSEELDEYTFNIIPRYDVVPRIDDVAQNFQKIDCLSTSPNPLHCHTNTRSLCELLFRCGSGPRPVICECTKRYGYPEPEQTSGNQTFDQLCTDVPLTPNQFSF